MGLDNTINKQKNKAAIALSVLALMALAACAPEDNTDRPTRLPTVTRTPEGSELTVQPTLAPSDLAFAEDLTVAFSNPTEVPTVAPTRPYVPGATATPQTQPQQIIIDEGLEAPHTSETELALDPSENLLVTEQPFPKILAPFNWNDGSDGFYMSFRDANGNFIEDTLFNSVLYQNNSLDDLTTIHGPFAIGKQTVLVIPGEVNGMISNGGNVVILTHSGLWGPERAFLQGEALRNFIQSVYDEQSLFRFSQIEDVTAEQLARSEAIIQEKITTLIGGEQRITQGTGKDLIDETYIIRAVSHVPHEGVDEFDHDSFRVIDVAQTYDIPERFAVWEKAKQPGGPQYLIITFCGWGPENEVDENGNPIFSTWDRFAVLLELKAPVES